MRLEVLVRKDDTRLLSEAASALSDPVRGADVRTMLREKLVTAHKGGMKALLAAAPLEGIDLDRGRDMGREVDF